MKKVSKTPDYVTELIRKKQIQTDKFHLAEIKTDELADFTACFLQKKDITHFHNQRTICI